MKTILLLPCLMALAPMASPAPAVAQGLAAADALEVIDVDYESLPAVLDMEEAIKEGADLVHADKGTNKSYEWVFAAGDIDAAFRDAPVVIERRYVQQRLIPSAMEPRAVVCSAVGDEYTLWSATQIPHILRLMLATVTGIPEHRLRVVVAGPHALEVEHAEAAEPPDHDRCPRGDDRVHGGREDGHVERVRVDRPRGRDVFRVTGAAARHHCHVVERVDAAGALGAADLDFHGHPASLRGARDVLADAPQADAAA